MRTGTVSFDCPHLRWYLTSIPYELASNFAARGFWRVPATTITLRGYGNVKWGESQSASPGGAYPD